MGSKTAPTKLKRGLRKLIQDHRLLIFVLVFALVGGTILLLATHAATPYATITADKGTLANGAQTITDTNASDGSAVKFGQGTVGTINPPSSWTNVTSNLANMSSQCGNLSMLSAVPNSNKVIAGVASGSQLAGLYEGAYQNGSITWTLLGANAGPTGTITNIPSSIVYDPAHPGTFWETGIYGSSYGVFRTTDGGQTFTGLGDGSNNRSDPDSATHVNSVGIDFTDPNRQTLLAGGHESEQDIFKSTNGGQSWTNIWSSLSSRINGAYTQEVIVINASTFLVSANGNGIYRTTDGGNSWTSVSSLGPEGKPLETTDGTIYWPMGDSLVTAKSPYTTWTQVGSGLLRSNQSGYGILPIELPDGRLVAFGNSGTGTLVVSSDGGSTWSNFGATIPTTADGATQASLIYSTGDKAFYVSHWDCGNTVQPDAILRGQ